MGLFFRKTFKVGPFNINLSKNGIGKSIGIKGFRVGKDSKGRDYTRAGLKGLYYQKYSKGKPGCVWLIALLPTLGYLLFK